MRKVLLITLSLVLALVGWSTVCAQDFYVVSGVTRNYAPVPKTGQTTSYAAGDDGALQKGVASPTSRFTDNGNGTVTDKLTKLIWLKNANAFGTQTWTQALNTANSLAAPAAGLTDGSKAGDWRLPNVKELLSLVDYGRFAPALPAGAPFTGVQVSNYWSSTADAVNAAYVWCVNFSDCGVGNCDKSAYDSVWCVRGGP